MNAKSEQQTTAPDISQLNQKRAKEASITVDGRSSTIPEDTYLVSDFKKLVGVDPSKELDEVVHGELKPLDDNQKIHIKSGEIFISHARQGGSS
jgi:hypothetical protein